MACTTPARSDGSQRMAVVALHQSIRVWFCSGNEKGAWLQKDHAPGGVEGSYSWMSTP